MAEFSRTRRIGEQLRRELAELIRTEIHDPRLRLVSITAVEVTRDLSYGKVFVTFLGDALERPIVLGLLAEAAMELRRLLGKRLRLRAIPKLTFQYDESVEYGTNLSALINRVVADARPPESHEP